MTLSRVALFFAAGFISFNSEATISNVWKYDAYIKGVQAKGNGDDIIYTLKSDLEACPSESQITVASNVNSVTADGSKNILALALVALSSKTKVSIIYDENSDECNINQLYLSNNS